MGGRLAEGRWGVKRGWLWCRCKEPEKRAFEEMILHVAGEDFVAVPHVHVEHTVAGVGPDNGNVSSFDDIFEADGVVGGRKGEQYLYVFVEAR